MMLMGGKVKRVLALAERIWANLLLEWEDGRFASLVCTGGASPFAANLKLAGGCETVEVNSDFFGAFTDTLVHFFETGEIPVSHEETISIMAAREAGLKAIEHPGVWIQTE